MPPYDSFCAGIRDGGAPPQKKNFAENFGRRWRPRPECSSSRSRRSHRPHQVYVAKVLLVRVVEETQGGEEEEEEYEEEEYEEEESG